MAHLLWVFLETTFHFYLSIEANHLVKKQGIMDEYPSGNPRKVNRVQDLISPLDNNLTNYDAQLKCTTKAQ